MVSGNNTRFDQEVLQGLNTCMFSGTQKMLPAQGLESPDSVHKMYVEYFDSQPAAQHCHSRLVTHLATFFLFSRKAGLFLHPEASLTPPYHCKHQVHTDLKAQHVPQLIRNQIENPNLLDVTFLHNLKTNFPKNGTQNFGYHRATQLCQASRRF